MRLRDFAVLALVFLPCGLSGQGIRIPRTGRGTPPTAAPLPPEIPAVSRALAYKRSRWSAESYAMVSTVSVPTTGSGTTSFTSFGTGTHADYRYTDRLSATLDMTISPIGGSATTETAEAGMRFRPMPGEHEFRPFFDVRAAYAHMHDTYVIPTGTSVPIGGPNQQLTEVGRYSRGLGSLAGAGVEYSLTRSLALTTEMSAVRNRMTSYRLTGAPSVSGRSSYWMTTYRYTLGLKYNPVTALHLAQKAGM